MEGGADEHMLQGSQTQPAELSTLVQLVDALPSSGEKLALLALGKEGEIAWTYAALARKVECLAFGLQKAGMGPGESAALLAETRPEAILACLAVIRTGAAIVPLDVQFGSRVLEAVLRDSGAGFLFTTAGRLERIGQLKLEREIRSILLDADAEDPRGWQALSVEAEGGFPLVSPADFSALFYTSGTTGVPKGVPLSHQNLAFQLNTLRVAELAGDTERVLLPLPLHHVYPFVTGMLGSLALGLTLVLPQSLTGPQIIRALRQGRVTFVVGVPRLSSALYSGIEARFTSQGKALGQLFKVTIRLLGWFERRLGWSLGKWLLLPLHRQLAPQLRTIASGGAALNPELAWKLRGLGWKIAIGYGLTETSPLLTINPPATRKLDSVGKPIPGTEIRIDASASPAEGRPTVSSGKDETYPVGEILARGPGVFTGYHNLPEKTGEVFSDGWFRTGDLGRFDEEGYLYVLGRASTLIVTEGGENVQPEEIEEAYQASPLIREIGVLQREGRLLAVIVPELSELRRQGKGDFDPPIREAVAQVSRQLPSYQRLSDYALTREQLPRTRLGKLRRHLLVEYFDSAKQEGKTSGSKAARPLSLEEMSDQDLALLDNSAAQQVWGWLARRYADQRLTPDTSPALDLGVDSLEWLNLTLEIRERTGVELGEEAISRIETVRDLLQAVAETEASEGMTTTASPEAFLEHPEEVLSESQRRWLQPLGRISSGVARSIFRLNNFLMRRLFQLRVEGLEHIPEAGQFVFVPNHGSYLDPFLVAAALGPGRLRRTYWGGWTEAAFRTSFQRLGSRLAGTIPIDPAKGVLSSLALGAAVLKRQKNLVWFPEGRRSPGGKLQPFKPGIGFLLEHIPVAVVPVAIHGSYQALPTGKRLPRLRTTITVSFSAPLDPRTLAQEGEGDKAYQRIANALQARIANLLA